MGTFRSYASRIATKNQKTRSKPVHAEGARAASAKEQPEGFEPLDRLVTEA
jgi:hypothetical protein